MRTLACFFFLCCLATSAAAAAPAPSHAKTGAPGTNVEMPYLMAPLTGSDGKLSGYAYISSRLTAASIANDLEVREKIAFIQDAFVRDVNGATVAKASDPGTVDQAALEARLLADAKRVMGPGKVASVTIVQLQIAPLRPHSGETPATTPPPGAPVPADTPKASPGTQTAAK